MTLWSHRRTNSCSGQPFLWVSLPSYLQVTSPHIHFNRQPDGTPVPLSHHFNLTRIFLIAIETIQNWSLADGPLSLCAVHAWAIRCYLANWIPSNSNPLQFLTTGHFLAKDKVTSILRLQLQCFSFTTVLFPHRGSQLLPKRLACLPPPRLIQTLGCWSSNCYT